MNGFCRYFTTGHAATGIGDFACWQWSIDIRFSIPAFKYPGIVLATSQCLVIDISPISGLLKATLRLVHIVATVEVCDATEADIGTKAGLKK